MESGIEEEGWEIVDYYPSFQDEQQRGEKSRLGWVMDAGKKIVVTGVVVSSIPLFLPPLVVISALGLALSVPFGVVFASYACTQKLMTRLLPSPAHPATPAHQDEQFEAEDIKEMDNQYDDGYSRDEIMREEPEVEIDDDVVKNMEVDEEEVQEEKGRSLDEQGDEPYFNVVKIDDVKQGEIPVPEENEKIITDTKIEDLPQEKNENVIIIEANKDEGEENGTVDKESVQEENEKNITETKKDEGEKMKKETGKRRKKKKDVGKRKEAEGENVESGKVIVVEEGTTPAQKIEVSSVVIQDDSGVTVLETTAIIADGKGTELKQDKEDNAGLPSENQEAFQDIKIWEKIDAIRGITGFKAPRRGSYYEELKALYLFTGIEAPATSPDTPAADFVEFYSKLCFLMSVIGVK